MPNKISKSNQPIEEQKADALRAAELSEKAFDISSYQMLAPGKGATVVFSDGTKVHGTIDRDSGGMLLWSDDNHPIYFDNINHIYWSYHEL